MYRKNGEYQRCCKRVNFSNKRLTSTHRPARAASIANRVARMGHHLDHVAEPNHSSGPKSATKPERVRKKKKEKKKKTKKKRNKQTNKEQKNKQRKNKRTKEQKNKRTKERK
jgi:hypothetical protein